LKGNFDTDKFKLYFADTGLLVSLLDEEAGEDLRANRNLGVYKGALYENIMGEALTKSGYDLYYYKREDSTLEEDFFVRSADDLIPVEIKSGNDQSKSMKELINNDNYPDIKYGIIFISGNIGVTDKVKSFPHFCIFLLKRYIEETT
jgi:predicted AAA+ superfamily ATPase